MWINRDLLTEIAANDTLEAVVVLGPRQVGKSTLLVHNAPRARFLSLDDLRIREQARHDPALLLSLHDETDIIFDEFQYAPELISELKLRIDSHRRQRVQHLSAELPRYYLSGSNQIEVEKSLRETLAGRVSIFFLHGLSIHEIFSHDPQIKLSNYLFRGGFPELYVRPALNPINYINDYLSTFVEKDIARSAGIQKIEEFLLVTRLLASRAGELVNNDAIAKDSGVASKTVGEWRDILDRAKITFALPVYSTNLNSRLIKTPKVYFIDPGLLTRLQGHLEESTILSTPQAGHLFENLVVTEALKTKDHFKKSWGLSFWRTKEKEEIDLIVESGKRRIFVEAKLAIQNVQPIQFSQSLSRVFDRDLTGCVVTPGGEQIRLNETTTRVPITQFAEYLLDFFKG